MTGAARNTFSRHVEQTKKLETEEGKNVQECIGLVSLDNISDNPLCMCPHSETIEVADQISY